MTITVKKVGELATKTAASAVSKSGISPGAVSQVVNRAVTKEEAPFVTPPRESTKVSLMPWKGWFQRWLRENIGEERFKKFRETFFFWPDDIYDLQPIKPATKVPISATDPNITRMYRYPSPGSDGPVNIPLLDDNEDPFDSGYFKRDTKRRYQHSERGNPYIERLKLSLMDQNDPAVQEEIARLEKGPESSPGNGGVFATGPSDFDPTGLRASMSVTWKAYEESLDSHMPDHLPQPIWVGNEEAEMKHYEDRGIPCPVGGYYEPLKVPTWRRVATW